MASFAPSGPPLIVPSRETVPASVETTATFNDWIGSQSFRLVSITRDAYNAVVTASVVWPDGVPGVFTTDVFSSVFPGTIDAYHVTYVPTAGPSKTITQPTVTRNSTGAVTVQPALVIS